MEISVTKILTNDNSDVSFFEARVIFRDETSSPHHDAEITVFLDKNDDLTLSEVKTLATQKARDFLSQI